MCALFGGINRRRLAIGMDEKTKELLLTLIENLSEPEYITQRECGEPCIKGKNLRFLKEMIKKM